MVAAMTARTLRIALLAVALALLAVAAAPAQAVTETATSGAVTATFTYSKKAIKDAPFGGRYRNLRLKVARAGVLAYDRKVRVPDCAEPYCIPAGYKESSVRATDLNGDGEPEVLLDVYTGGAHCCIWSLVLAWNGSAYRSRTQDWLDVGYKLTDTDKDGKQEFVSADARFAYEFASFAGSGFPVSILNFDPAQGFVDVTGTFPDAIRHDRDQWWKSYLKQRKHGETLGVLAAWAADEARLGTFPGRAQEDQDAPEAGQARRRDLGPGADGEEVPRRAREVPEEARLPPRREQHERDLAPRPARVALVPGPGLERPGPQPLALLGRGLAGAHRDGARADLDRGVRMRAQVVQPAGMAARTAVGGDDHVGLSVAHVEQRRGALPTAARAHAVEQQHGRAERRAVADHAAGRAVDQHMPARELVEDPAYQRRRPTRRPSR